jgi:uncharacterized protein CbrC (UPF0167 family)
MNLPAFRYHPDPIGSGSVVPSDATCECCDEARGFVYDGPVYSEVDVEAICPWCIASGDAHERFDASFVDSEAFGDGAPDAAIVEIVERTPGFSAWQGERWPVCCGDATAFLTPAGIAEIRETHGAMEGAVLSHIIHELQVSGGAALRTLESLRSDQSPTAFLFQCLHCEQRHVYVDRT